MRPLPWRPLKWVTARNALNHSSSLAILRDYRFNVLESTDITYFKGILPSSCVLEDESDLQVFNADWTGRFIGASKIVLMPTTTDQVSAILGYCNQRRLAVCPQGGNTGLVGGGVPIFDEIIVSLSKLNRILSFDQPSSVVHCEAGAVLQTVDDHLRSNYGHLMPLDLGAKGSCQIGGNIATNAGGLRFIRFGSLRGSVLGMQVVLANGKILDLENPGMRKDNTGYDLKQLFIGSEGTLGIITRASILAPRAPTATNVVILGVRSYKEVQQLMYRARRQLSDVLSAFEFWDKDSAELVFSYHQDLRVEFSSLKEANFYVLVETFHFSVNSEETETDRLMVFLNGGSTTENGDELSLGEEAFLATGAMAQNEHQLKKFWSFRELIPESASKSGRSIFKYDVSLPCEKLYALIEATKERLQPIYKDVKVIGYGHVGDGNVHLNVITPFTATEEFIKLLEPFVYEYVAGAGGSISAEHGLGLQKAHMIHYSKAPLQVEYMKSVKRLFDPNLILNPGKVLQLCRA